MDVIEIDAATNRGIDGNSRTARRSPLPSGTRPISRFTFFDEAHQITKTLPSMRCFKTLEEPPDHIVFMLATTTEP